MQIDEKYVNINPSKKRNTKHLNKSKKRLYTATIYAGIKDVGNKNKHKLMNKTIYSSTSLKKLKHDINTALQVIYKVKPNDIIYISGDLATYIQNFKEDVMVCKTIISNLTNRVITLLIV